MGGGGSKAAAVEKGAVRAAGVGRHQPQASAATAIGGAEPGINTAERQCETEERWRQQAAAALPVEQAQENGDLVRSMNKAMAGMRQYQYELYRNPELDKQYVTKKKTKEEREVELVGRLGTRTLKMLLDDHARSVRAGKPLSVAELARQYGADEEMLELVLRYIRTPSIHPTPEGQLVGRWPDEGENN